jgi:hypothetical protein
VGRKSIQSCGDTQHTGTSDEDPVQGECNTEELVTETSKEFATNIVNTVHIRMVGLEYTNDVIGPTRHGSDHQDDDHTRNQAQAVEHLWDGKNTQSNLRLQHEHSCTFPADLLTLVTCLNTTVRATYSTVIGPIFIDLSEDSIRDGNATRGALLKRCCWVKTVVVIGVLLRI